MPSRLPSPSSPTLATNRRPHSDSGSLAAVLQVRAMASRAVRPAPLSETPGPWKRPPASSEISSAWRGASTVSRWADLGLAGAGDGQQGGKARPVVGDPGTVEAAASVQRDILRLARRQHGVQVGGERHVRRRAERRHDIAGTIDRGIAAVGAELLQEPGGAFLLQKGGSGHAAKLHVNFVDPLLLAGEELQALADSRVVRDLG